MASDLIGNTIAGTLTDGDKGDITVSSSGSTFTIDNDVVTYAKMQNVSATDKLLGRSTAGAGDVEEITCTAAGRALIDDANAAAQIATLGLDADLATLALPASTTISAFGATLVDDANAAATIATLGLDADLATFALPASTTISAFGKTVVDDADAAAVRTTIGAANIAGDTFTGDVIVPDEAYSAVDWNGSLEVPTKNAVRDKLESLGVLSDADKGDITVSGTGSVWTIDNDVVTYAKMQNVSATDKLLGRSTAGAGDVEEIACTAAGRALLDDANAAAQIATLGLDADIATLALPASTTISAFGATLVDDANAAAAIATLGLDADIATLALPASTTISAFGKTLVDDADATAAIATLGLDADIATLALPANTTISAFGKTVVDDADAAAVRTTIGAPNIAGDTFTGDVIVPDEAYDAAAWNGSLEVPTKNAVRDKIEAGLPATPAGADTQVQFNDGGALGGDAGLVYDKATNRLTVTGLVKTGGFTVDGSVPGDENWLLTGATGDFNWNNTVTGLNSLAIDEDTDVVTFVADPLIPDEAYSAGDWNGSLEPPTKNAVRDIIETKQNLDATLTALAAYNTDGLIAQTAADTFAGRTITGTANKVTVTNGGGVAGNPTLTLPDAITLVTPTITGTTTLAAALTGVLRADSGVVSTDADITDLVTAASDTAQGKVELATTAETTTGTDATRAVTPDGLHDMTSLAGAVWFLDEDNMASDSATKTASQQSIKAYADTKQTLDADLTTIAGLTATTDNFMVAASSAWASRTPSQAKTSLALVKGDVGLGNVDNTSDATKLTALITQSVVVQFGDGTNVIAINDKRRFSIPVAHTLIRWRILSSVSGTIEFDVWRDTFANYPPVLADSISTSHPTLTAATSAEDSSITDWTEAGSAGDVYIVNVHAAPTSCVDVVLELWYTRALNV